MRALIFDVDGTLADTETAHRDAFNAAFAEAGLDWHWDEALYADFLGVTGGKERMLHYWLRIDPEAARGAGAQALIDELHAAKTRHYTAYVASGAVPLRPGIRRLIDEATAAGIPLAIATTTTPVNLEALLSGPFGPDWRKRFVAVCDGATAPIKKPAPDVYYAALEQLGLGGAECLAIEDSYNGVRAATAAGIPTVVTTTAYTEREPFHGALVVLPNLGDPQQPLAHPAPGMAQGWVDLATLRRWHEAALSCEN